MLVLSRKAGESIRISDDIKIVVLHVEGQRVRLGVQAPKSLSIVRSELDDPNVAKANQTAAVNMGGGKELLKQAAQAQKHPHTDPPAGESPAQEKKG